ncbi:DMT family transporter [Nesterenkonia pannonica]|uniref:DMT family transporter n=1 Tax=Nesterenkonia pannonica TaxID=1548602 RepID=UPI0021644FFD|nr:DMT family transporter [Nesterenkonia pannonica]
MGLSPAGRKPLTLMRGTAAALTVVAIMLILVPGISGDGFGAAWILSAGLALLAGMLNAYQQVINARQSAAYVSPAPVTLINFTAGLLALVVAYLVRGTESALGSLPELTEPTNWWYYAGGPLGCLLIAVSAVLIGRVGALAAGIGITAGHLLGAVAVDLVAPAEGVVVTGWTLGGIVIALGASCLIGLSGPRRPVRQR